MLLLCLKLSSCLVANTSDTSVMYAKAKFVCLYLMRPQKIKFESVQINMKHVLYYLVSDLFSYPWSMPVAPQLWDRCNTL